VTGTPTILDEAVDPVVDPTQFCTTNIGLIVSGGVTLDLGGNTIRGDHTNTGVKIDGDGATVTNGTISGFATGLSTAKAGGAISKIKALRNKTEGIKVTGHDNTLLSNTAEANGVDGGSGDGISVSGDNNPLKSNKAKGNAGSGINVSGKGNTLEKNTAEENSEDGIKVAGGNCTTSPGDNTVTGNKAFSNRDNGINVTGSSNTVEKNTANENFRSGIDVSGDCNALTGNKADKNSGDGGVFVDGKKNHLKKNTAKRNEGRGIFAKDFTIATDDNINDGGNKGTDNRGVGAVSAVDINCEISGAACAP